MKNYHLLLRFIIKLTELKLKVILMPGEGYINP